MYSSLLQRKMNPIEVELKGIEEKFQKFSIEIAKEVSSIVTKITDVEEDSSWKAKRVLIIDEEIADLVKEKERLNEVLDKNSGMLNELNKRKGEVERKVDKEMSKFKKRQKELKENSGNKLEAEKQQQVAPPVTCNSQIVDFLISSICSKERDLECPVCLETSSAPIYSCPESHIICASCRPKVQVCPECRATYHSDLKRHRFAEKTAEELEELKKQLTIVTTTKPTTPNKPVFSSLGNSVFDNSKKEEVSMNLEDLEMAMAVVSRPEKSCPTSQREATKVSLHDVSLEAITEEPIAKEPLHKRLEQQAPSCLQNVPTAPNLWEPLQVTPLVPQPCPIRVTSWASWDPPRAEGEPSRSGLVTADSRQPLLGESEMAELFGLYGILDTVTMMQKGLGSQIL